MKITKTIKAAALAALAVMTVSCAEELDFRSSKSFLFDVKTEGPMQTKSDMNVETEDFDISFDDLKVTLTATVTPNLDDPFSSIQTKAREIKSADDFSKFAMDIQNVGKVSVEKGTRGWAIVHPEGVSYLWPESVSETGLKFDSMYGDGATISGNKVSYDWNKSKDSDLLVARTYATHNDVPVTFYHPLSALRFKVKGFVDGFTVTKIELNSLCTTGSFNLTTNTDGTVNAALDLSTITWNDDLSGAKVIEAPIYTDKSPEELFIIPQKANVTLSITFSQENGPDKVLTLDMPQVGLGTDGTWKAGYYYTYTISGGGFVDVVVEEDSFTNGTSTTKSSVIASNTGSVASYIRAAVVGNWYNEVHKIVAPWTDAIEPAQGSNWVKGDDGFFYYTLPVRADAKTEELIESYTVTNSPVPGAHLELNVLVQAVEYDEMKQYVGEAWTSAPSSLSKLN